MYWDLGSMAAERVGEGFQQWAEIAWLLLDLECPWLALGGPFARVGLQNNLLATPFLAQKFLSRSVWATIGQEP